MQACHEGLSVKAHAETVFRNENGEEFAKGIRMAGERQEYRQALRPTTRTAEERDPWGGRGRKEADVAGMRGQCKGKEAGTAGRHTEPGGRDGEAWLPSHS